MILFTCLALSHVNQVGEISYFTETLNWAMLVQWKLLDVITLALRELIMLSEWQQYLNQLNTFLALKKCRWDFAQLIT